jgi:hypothetical protein
MTYNTAIQAARKLIITNGLELVEEIEGVRHARPIPAGQTPRLALANARKAWAEAHATK